MRFNLRSWKNDSSSDELVAGAITDHRLSMSVNRVFLFRRCVKFCAFSGFDFLKIDAGVM